MPEPISFAVLALTAAVLGARIWLFNSSRSDRAFNLAASLLTAVAAFRDEWIQRGLSAVTRGQVSPSLLNQASEAAITLSAAAFLLVGLAWLNVRQPRWVSVAVWLAAGASTLAVQVVVRRSDPLPAATHGLHTGWAIIGYSGDVPTAAGGIVAHDALSYSFCLLLLVLCGREFSRRPRGLELLATTWVATLVLGWFLQTLSVSIVTLAAATGRHSSVLGHYAAFEYASPLFYAAGVAMLAAIPLVRLAVEYIRAELISRILNHRLNPLWTALTAVCPEIVHSAHAHKAMAHPRYQLHLRVIEIRDAVMILSRYITLDMIAYSHKSSDEPALRQAIELQMASGAKLRGEIGTSPVSPAPVSSTAGLIDDATDLLNLAHWWPTATRVCAAAGRTGRTPAAEEVLGVRPGDDERVPRAESVHCN